MSEDLADRIGKALEPCMEDGLGDDLIVYYDD